MASADESVRRALELDQLVESQRRGDLTDGVDLAWATPLVEIAADLGTLGQGEVLPSVDAVWSRVSAELGREPERVTAADVAVGLGTLGTEAVLPDEEVVWSRVSIGIGADGSLDRRPAMIPWWRVGPFGRRPLLWGPVGAAAAVLIAVVLMLAQPPTNTAEAFVRDVEALSQLADAALADHVLTDDEKNSVAELAMELRLAVDRRPETLIELDAETRVSVLATLADVTARLMPIADEELVELRGEPVAAPSLAVEAAAGEAAIPATATEVPPTPQATLKQAAAPDVQNEASTERRSNPPDGGPGGGGVAPVVASSVTSLNEVASAVLGAGQGNVVASVPAVTPGYLLGLCRELRGPERSGCQRAINAAIAACVGAADRHALDDCLASLEFATEVCEALLPEREAARCSEALRGLESGGDIRPLQPQSGQDRGRIGESSNDGDGDRDGRRDEDRRDGDRDD